MKIYDGTERKIFTDLMGQFSALHPEIKVQVLFFRGDRYTERLQSWFKQGSGPDLVFWYGGSRIHQSASEGKLHNLDDVWLKYNFDARFSEFVRDSVIYNQAHYAVPISYYHWAFYYRASLLSKWGLEPPKTWLQMLSACRVLRKEGLDLIALGSKQKWVTHAWFDYINLRLNGLEFYRHLLHGELSYTDPRVEHALQLWLRAFDAQCFNANHARYSSAQVFPRLYHGLSVMTLAGFQPKNRVPASVVDDLKIMAFPQIDPARPDYEVTPVDAFVVPHYARLSPDLNALLVFISGDRFQQQFNYSMSKVPAALAVQGQVDMFARQSERIVSQAKGRMHFLDRETLPSFSEKVPKILVDFITHKDVSRAANELESVRRKVFSVKQVENRSMELSIGIN